MDLKTFFTNYFADFRERVLSETPLLDFKEKHLYLARLRIFVFLITWVMFFIFYPEIWSLAPAVPLVFNIGFLVTTICYWFILREQAVFVMLILEIFVDIISQTTIIYVLGLHHP